MADLYIYCTAIRLNSTPINIDSSLSSYLSTPLDYGQCTPWLVLQSCLNRHQSACGLTGKLDFPLNSRTSSLGLIKLPGKVTD